MCYFYFLWPAGAAVAPLVPVKPDCQTRDDNSYYGLLDIPLHFWAGFICLTSHLLMIKNKNKLLEPSGLVTWAHRREYTRDVLRQKKI